MLQLGKNGALRRERKWMLAKKWMRAVILSRTVIDPFPQKERNFNQPGSSSNYFHHHQHRMAESQSLERHLNRLKLEYLGCLCRVGGVSMLESNGLWLEAIFFPISLYNFYLPTPPNCGNNSYRDIPWTDNHVTNCVSWERGQVWLRPVKFMKWVTNEL